MKKISLIILCVFIVAAKPAPLQVQEDLKMSISEEDVQYNNLSTHECWSDCVDCERDCDNNKSCKKMCWNISKACCKSEGKEGIYMMCGCR